MKLRTYEDLFKNLWSTFETLSKDCSQIDIIFDLYLQNSVKEQERNRRRNDKITETIITSVKQVLPVELIISGDHLITRCNFNKPLLNG